MNNYSTIQHLMSMHFLWYSYVGRMKVNCLISLSMLPRGAKGIVKKNLWTNRQYDMILFVLHSRKLHLKSQNLRKYQIWLFEGLGHIAENQLYKFMNTTPACQRINQTSLSESFDIKKRT